MSDDNMAWLKLYWRTAEAFYENGKLLGVLDEIEEMALSDAPLTRSELVRLVRTVKLEVESRKLELRAAQEDAKRHDELDNE